LAARGFLVGLTGGRAAASPTEAAGRDKQPEVNTIEKVFPMAAAGAADSGRAPTPDERCYLCDAMVRLSDEVVRLPRPAPLDAFYLEHRLCGALDERGPRSHCGRPSSLNTPCRGGLLGQLGEGFGVREIRRNRRDNNAGFHRHEFYPDQ